MKGDDNIKILSLDNSTTVCGFAVWEDDTLIESGAIKASKKDNAMMRMEYLFGKIQSLVDKHKITYIIFEDGFQRQNVKTLKMLCRFQGCIMGLCIVNDLGFYIYLPSEWRSRLWRSGAKREEQKRLAVEYANKHYGLGLEFADNDEAEAICIGAAFNKIKEQKEMKV